MNIKLNSPKNEGPRSWI